ncbi:hypothetical protein HPB51_029396 [Rhipicephalus microplus]|uniref:Uncharacterized protein n=1 Tax=Rhipicephalus microplus TaxID=6941 RepID=A0A9J6CUN7_RHIMP|nr:hypothetical protein HPB51_029396 [Rhipicephalus microplus]
MGARERPAERAFHFAKGTALGGAGATRKDAGSQDLLDLKLLGLRLETKLTILEGLVNKLGATSNKCSQGGRTGGSDTDTEVATSDTQERILRAQQAIIDISNRNTVELENLAQLVTTQTSKLANRSDAMLGLLKSSELVLRRQPPQETISQGRRHHQP